MEKEWLFVNKITGKAVKFDEEIKKAQSLAFCSYFNELFQFESESGEGKSREEGQK
jgi:hypothetical protein